jgi:hypothetical protein
MPVLLAQPVEDRRTPPRLSQPLIGPMTKAPVATAMLDGAGHDPLEQTGLDQMVGAVRQFAGPFAAP